jgi:hypothetical protein
VWTAGGELIYSNRGGGRARIEPVSPIAPGVTQFVRDERRFERRGIAVDAYGTTYVLEIVREL